MWDTFETQAKPLSHELPCPGCGHATHTYLPCSDGCDCAPRWLPLEACHWASRELSSESGGLNLS